MMYGVGGRAIPASPKAVRVGHIGLGSYIMDPGNIAMTTVDWASWLFPQAPTVAKPGVPQGWETGNVNAGEITRLVNQQMIDQQNLNRGLVVDTMGSNVGGALYQGGEAVKSVLPWGILAVAGIGIAALAVMK